MLSILVSCGFGGISMRRSEKPTITQEQAIARLEQLVAEAVANIDPKPRLELFEPSLTPGNCLDPMDGGSEDRLVLSRAYWLRGISKDGVVEIAGQVKRNWEQKGYRIKSTGFDSNKPDISGFSVPDDFILLLERTEEGGLYLGVTSTCIWPNGTPEPSSESK
ncbi:hypothetical protein [Rhizohabitans arisaemae]|uniref:hypothetical protein n=1 Tax=Rhizohabitans arisaemae TaxID=2720610 RepID=UPI0024B152D7|nr:hypothetical protein [Rhizohabitans arisaemae]